MLEVVVQSYSNPMQDTSSWVTKGSNFVVLEMESDFVRNSEYLTYLRRSLGKIMEIAKIYDEQPYVFLFSSKSKMFISRGLTIEICIQKDLE